MSDFKETQHGRNHSKRGSDPIGDDIRQAVLFNFESQSSSPNYGDVRQTVFGYTHDTPHYESKFALTLPLIALIGTVVEIGYIVLGPATALITFDNIVVTNFTTGQTEKIVCTTVAAPYGTSDLVSWDTHDSGSVLMDRTFPQTPSFAVAGNYVITANGSVDFA